MKKALLLFLAMTVVFTTVATDAKTKTKVKQQKTKVEKTAKNKAPKAIKKHITRKDILRDDEYKMRKTEFFNADGYGNIYNCAVEEQRFCRVKDLDTGLFVLCDRDVSRTQWESAKIFYKYGRCTKMN